jgi:hypothetical protein
MSEPAVWKPRTQYLVADPTRGPDSSSVQPFPTLKEAQVRVKYWEHSAPDSGFEYCIVKAVTTYTVVQDMAAATTTDTTAMTGATT